jgi:hypothetical protein
MERMETTREAWMLDSLIGRQRASARQRPQPVVSEMDFGNSTTLKGGKV